MPEKSEDSKSDNSRIMVANLFELLLLVVVLILVLQIGPESRTRRIEFASTASRRDNILQ